MLSANLPEQEFPDDGSMYIKPVLSG